MPDTQELPTLPERLWSRFCTKCGREARIEKPEHPERGVLCPCGYMAFAHQAPGWNEEQVRSYVDQLLARRGDWKAAEAYLTEYVADYEMVGEDEDGRDGVYMPNEHERGLILDAIHGLLADDAFLALVPDRALSNMAPLQQRVAELEREIEGLRADKRRLDFLLGKLFWINDPGTPFSILQGTVRITQPSEHAYSMRTFIDAAIPKEPQP